LTTVKPTSFTLGSHELTFIADMVQNGRFGNRTEVVRASLRLLEDYEYNEKAKRLRTLIDEGIADLEAGRVTEYSSAEEMAQAIIDRGRTRLNATDY